MVRIAKKEVHKIGILHKFLFSRVDSFRSLFQLLRTRQAPYFYVITNKFNILFCAAGTRGMDHIQAYVTPSSKGFREALSHEGKKKRIKNIPSSFMHLQQR
jgi:hypothetical protein